MSPAEPISVIPVAASLLAVVATIFGLGWLMRRLPGVGRGSNGAMRIVSALPVGQRERVLWIEVGGQHLVIGVTGQGISKIHEFATPPETPSAPTGPNVSNLFAEQLRKALGQAPKS